MLLFLFERWYYHIQYAIHLVAIPYHVDLAMEEVPAMVEYLVAVFPLSVHIICHQFNTRYRYHFLVHDVAFGESE